MKWTRFWCSQRWVSPDSFIFMGFLCPASSCSCPFPINHFICVRWSQRAAMGLFDYPLDLIVSNSLPELNWQQTKSLTGSTAVCHCFFLSPEWARSWNSSRAWSCHRGRSWINQMGIYFLEELCKYPNLNSTGAWGGEQAWYPVNSRWGAAASMKSKRWASVLGHFWRSTGTKSVELCLLQILEDEIQADFYVAVPAIIPKLIPLRGKLKRKYPSTRKSKRQFLVITPQFLKEMDVEWRGATDVFSDEDVELHSVLDCRWLHRLS